jgi:hypothetical protein
MVDEPAFEVVDEVVDVVDDEFIDVVDDAVIEANPADTGLFSLYLFDDNSDSIFVVITFVVNEIESALFFEMLLMFLPTFSVSVEFCVNIFEVFLS